MDEGKVVELAKVLFFQFGEGFAGWAWDDLADARRDSWVREALALISQARGWLVR